jgi:dephospho-CoA kinase
MNNNDNLKSNIISIFGNSSYFNNSLNSKYISSKVFNDPLKLKELNNLVHPLVSKDFKNWLSNKNSNDIIFKEAAILIESEAYKELDKIIVISCPENIRIQRVLKRDGYTLESVQRRIQNQLSEIERIKYADFVIKNSGSKTDLVSKVKSLISELRKLN